MVKSKKKVKKGLADAVSSKKSGGVTKLNPFNIRTIRSKTSIIGREKKVQVGQPGISRAKGIQIRKDTLLQEFKIRNKSNLFVDKRIGEKNAKLSAEDKMIARYTSEKMKNAGRSSIFNLGDADTLTHKGHKIDEIDQFEKPGSDDEGDEGILTAEYTGEAHFGGFMTRADDEFKSGRGNNRKDFIDNLIKESKARKAEKQMLEAEIEEKTSKLDSGWAEMLTNIQCYGLMPKPKFDPEVTQDVDPYDSLVRQLGFEKKGAQGKDRLKTANETIKEEKERLEKLEADRLRRMRGERTDNTKQEISGIVGVEDLGDGKNRMSKSEKKILLEQLLNAASEENSEDENGDEEQEEDGGSDREQEDSEEESEEEEDNYSDLEGDDEQEQDAAEPTATDEMSPNEKDRYDAETKEMIEKATAEIPYSFTVPQSYSEFSEIVRGRSVDEIVLIVDRILKCNHPSLADGNKEKLSDFYSLLLQFVNDCATAYDEEGEGEFNLELIGLKAISALIPMLFKLTAMFPDKAAKSMQEVIKEKYEGFDDSEGRKQMPGLDTLIFIRLVFLLFPASDFRHPVVTPTIVFCLQILSSARPTDRASFASGLLLASFLTESSLLSKRYSPELINFLAGIFFVSMETLPTGKFPPPPCRGGKLLVVSQKVSAESLAKLRLSDVTSVKGVDDMFRTQCLSAASDITLKLLDLYAKLPSVHEIFAPVIESIKHISKEKLHDLVAEKMREIEAKYDALPAKTGAIVRPAKPLRLIKQLDPEIEDNFDPNARRRDGDKDVKEMQKLRYQVRQEKKGARKEIRKDMAFLSARKFQEQKLKDQDRMEKTKRILNGLATQEGDYQKIYKKQKKKF